jgi:AcrR family transcriptional regulator
MARWAPDAAPKMREAAFDLFSRNGFANVTAAEIAAAAGVTERTFFRHFPTKEDVLFSEGAEIVSDLSSAIVASPPATSASDLLLAALVNLAESFEPNREHHRLRASIIASVPALRERELLKRHYIAIAIVEEFVKRGVPRVRATSLSGVGMVVFEVAYSGWVIDRSRTQLATRIEKALGELASDLRA